MSKVYVTQEAGRKVDGRWVPKVDLSPAMQFGEIVILQPAGSSFYLPKENVRELKERLREFTDEDYIIPMGDPVLMCAAVCIASQRTGGRLKILKWDKFSHSYTPINLEV